MRSYSITHPPGTVMLPTQPGWAQVVFAPTGGVTAHTPTDAWTVPTHRALRVPDGMTVRIETTRRTPVRCLYLATRLVDDRSEIRVVNLNPLTRELLTHAISTSPADLTNAADAALITLLVDQLNKAETRDLHLPIPTNPEARTLAAVIMDHPAHALDWQVRAVPAHRRSLERLFRAETGMALGQWRRRARILHALALLSDGADVTQAAAAVGYASSSSFVAAFHSELGQPPRQFLKQASHQLAVTNMA